MSNAKTALRFKAVMRPSTLRDDGSLCVFRAGVIDTETNEIVYVANREDSRSWAAKLNGSEETVRMAQALAASGSSPNYPLHAVYATAEDMNVAVHANDAEMRLAR